MSLMFCTIFPSNTKIIFFYQTVGAGSAGAVMANRLSEDSSLKVLLLEAGGSENLFSDIPIAAATLQMTPIDWAYQTEPQEASCFGLINRVRNISNIVFFSHTTHNRH